MLAARRRLYTRQPTRGNGRQAGALFLFVIFFYYIEIGYVVFIKNLVLVYFEKPGCRIPPSAAPAPIFFASATAKMAFPEPLDIWILLGHKTIRLNKIFYEEIYAREATFKLFSASIPGFAYD